MTNEKIFIGLVEDQLLFREGMKAILSSWNQFEVSFESANGYSVSGSLEKMERLPDVLLVDLSLPPDGDKEFSGVQVTDAVTQAFLLSKSLFFPFTRMKILLRS